MTLLLHPLARKGLTAYAALICSALVLTGCQDKKPVTTTKAPTPVSFLTVKASDEGIWAEALGTAEGVREAEVRAQVSGTLEKIAYKEGDRVKKGDTLFVLDQDLYRAPTTRPSPVANRPRRSSRKTSAKRSATRRFSRPRP